MLKNYLTPLLCGLISINTFAQKDCDHDHTGLVPITDLGAGLYRGTSGGLYPGGSNVRPTEYLDKCIEHAQNILPLNTDGEYDENGKIIMLGIGASNPGAEFAKFVSFSNAFEPLNDNLVIINACMPSTGLQEMNYTYADYWDALYDLLEENGYSSKQVQVIWVEEENTDTGDTTFPAAALALVEDYLALLQAVHYLYPNTQLCYLSARAYSGYASPSDETIENGLLYPRDYLNGWSIKWFIENVINNELGYNFEEPEADIPLVTWGTYHWTDGSTPRLDGLYLDCEVDVAEDGLHLSGSGELKMGQLMFNYFSTDTTAKYWYYDQDFTGIADMPKNTVGFYPNPVTADGVGHLNAGIFELNEPIAITVYSPDGKMQLSENTQNAEDLTVDLDGLDAGMYFLTITSENKSASAKFIVSK